MRESFRSKLWQIPADVSVENQLRLLIIMVSDLETSRCPTTKRLMIEPTVASDLKIRLNLCLVSVSDNLQTCCEIATEIKNLHCIKCDNCQHK
jgi:hypothetical protein